MVMTEFDKQKFTQESVCDFLNSYCCGSLHGDTKVDEMMNYFEIKCTNGDIYVPRTK